MKHAVVVATTILVIVLSCGSLWAASTAPFDAELAITGWLRLHSQPLGVTLGHQVVRVETFTDDCGEPLCHIVYLHPSGFVIVSGDDRVEPIIGFAAEGFYTPALDDPLGALVTRDLSVRIAAVRSTSPPSSVALQSTASHAREKWLWLCSAAERPQQQLSTAGEPDIDEVWVAPFVMSTWDQKKACDANCYNLNTPHQYPCGCAATAMAQVMRYHKWPHAPFYEAPTSPFDDQSFPVYVDGTEWGRRWLKGGDGFGGPYRWDLMDLTPDCDTTDIEREAIGRLCHDAGIASGMNYTAKESGTSLRKARDALLYSFRYANAILGSNNGEGEHLLRMINPNLDAGYPVVVSLFHTEDEDAAHGAIVDGYGYDEVGPVMTAYHHLNLGASGNEDLYYNLPEVDSTNLGPYNIVGACIYNIFPDRTGEIISGRVMSSAGFPISGASVEAWPPPSDFWEVESPSARMRTDHRGVYALGPLPSEDTYEIRVQHPFYQFTTRTVTTGASSDPDSWTLGRCGNRWAIDFVGEPTTIFPVYSPLWEEDFEQGLRGWSGGTGVQVTSSTSVAGGDHSLTVIGNLISAGHGLGTLRPVGITFHVRASATNQAVGYFVLRGECWSEEGPESRAAVLFYMRADGKMGLWDGTTFWGTPYARHTWYKIKLVLHWQRRRVDYYVDDRLVENAIPFRNSVASLNSLSLYNHDNSQAWWDEIALWPSDLSPSILPE